MTFDEYLSNALKEDSELKKEYDALQPTYEREAKEIREMISDIPPVPHNPL